MSRACRAVAIAVALALQAGSGGCIAMAQTGAPRLGDRFENGAGPRPSPAVGDMFQFLLGKAWSSIARRSGAALRLPYDPAAMRHNPSLTWIGHATFLVRMDGVTFLTDPMFSERASPVSFAGPERLVEPGVPLDALPPLDFALVSHDHYDHLDLPTIAALAQRGVPVFVPLGVGALIREAGGSATELDWWQSVPAGRVRIHCVPAQHFSGRSLTDGNRRLWSGWVVEGRTRRFFHAGDTGYFAGFAEIAARIGAPDLAALPIGAYDPAGIMRFVHMNPEEAMQAAVDLGAGIAVGMHYGTFDLTDEPLDEPPRRFHAAASQQALSGVTPWTMQIGETRRW